jgi:hypothetical protein
MTLTRGAPKRVDDPKKLPDVLKAAELWLGGWHVYEIAVHMDVCEKTIQRYLHDADDLFQQATLATATQHLARALARRAQFARNLGEVRTALSKRDPKTKELDVTFKEAHVIIEAVKAEMANQDRVEKLTGVEKEAATGGTTNISGRDFIFVDARGTKRLIRVGGDGRSMGPAIIIADAGTVEGEVIEDNDEAIVEVEDDGSESE